MPDRALQPGQSVDTGCPFFVPKKLSKRELQALTLAARGYTDVEIAGELILGERTVRRYVQSAIHKLNARNRANAVVIALARQVITFDAVLAN